MLFLHLAYLLVGGITTLIGPLLPFLTHAWHIDDGQAGAMLGAQFVCSMTAGFGSTALAQRVGVSRSLSGAFLVMATGLLLLLTGRWPLVLVAAAIWGTGLGLAVHQMNMQVALSAGPRGAAALSLFNVMWGSGALLWSGTVYLAARQVGPVALIAGMAGLALATSAGFALGLGPAPLPRPTPSQRGGPAHQVPWGPALSAAFMLFLYGGVENSVGGWAASYVSRMAGPEGAAIGAAAPAAFYAALATGRLSMVGLLRMFPETPVLVAGQCVAFAALLGLLVAGTPAWVVGAASLAGLGWSVVYPVTAAGIARRVGRRSPAMVGPLLAFGGLGSASFPWMVGLVSRRSGSLRMGLLVAVTGAVALMAMTAVNVRLARRADDHQQESLRV